MPMPPSNSRLLRVPLPTSSEGVLEGEGVEDSEALSGAHSEAALVLVEAHEEDLLLGGLASGADDCGLRLNER